MPDINRDISIEQVDYNIDIEQANYTIEINPTSTFEIQLNEQGPQGARGYTGNGISSYELTSSIGLTDTYTITFTDGNTTTVDVNNGRGINSITGPVSVGNIDTYTINYNDNTTSTFTVTNGIDGVNPTVTVGTTTTGNPGTNASVINTGTVQDVILDFTIPRGDKGESGTAATIAVGTVTTGLPTDPASVTNVGTSSAAIFDFTIPQGEKGDTGATGATGNGIASISKTSTSGLVDTYTVTYTNGNTTTFDVTNGADGTDGQDGAGTVNSVNNVQPDANGNVTLTIPDTSNLANKDLSNLSSTGNSKFQVPLESGTNIKTINNTSILGSGDITIQSAPDIDNVTISTNSDDELQTIGVIDDNSGNAIKTWTGTKAQYDAIVTKDATTLYNITDDTDTTLTLLELLFPVGAVYFGTMATCPLQTLGVGTWQALPPDKVIQIAGTRGSVGDTLNESLPNITGSFGNASQNQFWSNQTGAFRQTSSSYTGNGVNNTTNYYVDFDASRSSSTYQNNVPVQQDAYLLRGWERIS